MECCNVLGLLECFLNLDFSHLVPWHHRSKEGNMPHRWLSVSGMQLCVLWVLQGHLPSRMKRQLFLMRKPEQKQSHYVSSVENRESKALNLGSCCKASTPSVKGPTFIPVSSQAPRSLQKSSQKCRACSSCTVCTKNLRKPGWYWLPLSPSLVPGAWLSCNSGVLLLVLGWMGWAEGWEAPDSLG